MGGRDLVNPRNGSWTMAKGNLNRQILCRTDFGDRADDLSGTAAQSSLPPVR